MSDTPICPECGSGLSPGAPKGLCPRCLLYAVLAGTENREFPEDSTQGGPAATSLFAPVHRITNRTTEPSGGLSSDAFMRALVELGIIEFQ